ncbi:MAG TPA: POTRA domain-containing protein, partial [bacterium]|nr:POTRA domain-containing protein [bacterium]
MTFRFFTFLICIGVYSIAYTSANAQTGASGRVEKFRALYEDSSGVWIDSLPTAEDSVFIKNKKYYFTGVNSRGKETGLDAFDDLTLNLSLTVGEEEERQLGWFTRAVSWTGNNLIRILSLTFYDPEWGANRYFFNAETFANDLKVINQLYNDKGYFDATIVKYTAKFDKHRESIEITIYIYEGEPTTLAEDPDIHIQSPIPVADPGSKFQRKKI